MSHLITSVVYDVSLFDENKVSQGASDVIEAIGGIGVEPSDTNVEVPTMSKDGGVSNHISTMQENNTTLQLSVTAATETEEPVYDKLLQSCARIKEASQVLTLNENDGGDLTVSEDLIITSTAATPAALDLNAATAVDDTSIDLDSDGAMTLNKGTTFTIDGDVNVYTVAATVIFAGAETQTVTLETPILQINDVDDVITLGSNLGTVGKVYSTVGLAKVDGTLAVDNALIGATEIDVTITFNADWDHDTIAKIPAGSQIKIDANYVTVTSDAEWLNTTDPVTVSVTALPAAIVGGETISLVESKWCFIFGLDVTPAVGDTLTGQTSSNTAKVYGTQVARLYYPSLQTQYSCTIGEYMDGLYIEAPYSRGTATVSYPSGATPDINFTMNAKYKALENQPMLDYTTICAILHSTNDSFLRYNGYDLRKHANDGVTMELGNELSSKSSITTETGLIEYKITDIKPNVKFNTTQEALNLFNPTADRVANTEGEIVYIHNFGGAAFGRVAHIYPRTQQDSMSKKGDKDKLLSFDLSLGVLNSCGTIPKEGIYAF